MNKIYLVRHGQASFGQDNYDQLSALGFKQAELLAQGWSNRGLSPQTWMVGDLSRQQDTMDKMRSTLITTDGNSSAPIVNADLNEFPAEGITKHYLPKIVADKNDPALTRELIFSDNLIFQQLFGEVVQHWVTADPNSSKPTDFESWEQYKSRVHNGIKSITEVSNTAEELVVVTSAGFIAATLMHLFDEINQKMFKLAWNIINASVTEIHNNKGQLYVHSFNDYSHLKQQPELITYR